MPGDTGSRKGWENDLARRFGYPGWVCHAGVINITVMTFSFAILQSTLWINENGGNAYRISWFHSCCIACVAKLCGSGFQAKYFAIWLDNLKANRSITDIPIFWQICRNTIGDNFHYEKSFLWQDYQSALVFRIPGRYSAVIVICFNIRYFQMSLLISTSVLSVVSPSFRRYERAVVLSVWILIALIGFSFVKGQDGIPHR